MYLAIKNANTHWTMPIKEWRLAVNLSPSFSKGSSALLIFAIYTVF